MSAQDHAYCSTILEALSLLLQIIIGSILATLFLTWGRITVDFDRDPRVKLFAAFSLISTVLVLMLATCLVEVLMAAELLRTSTRVKLRGSLYLARIKLFRFLGLGAATVVLLALFAADDTLATRSKIARGYYYDTSVCRGWAFRFVFSYLPVNLFTLLAMFLGGGVEALIMEAKTAWKTLHIAELFSMQKEWAVTDVELQGSQADHGPAKQYPRVRFDDNNGVNTPPLSPSTMDGSQASAASIN